MHKHSCRWRTGMHALAIQLCGLVAMHMAHVTCIRRPCLPALCCARLHQGRKFWLVALAYSSLQCTATAARTVGTNDPAMYTTRGVKSS